MEKWSSG